MRREPFRARRAHREVVDRATVLAIARLVAMSGAMGLGVWLTLLTLGTNPGATIGEWTWRLVRLAAGVGVGGAAYLGLALLTRSQELRSLVGARAARARSSGADPGDIL